MHNCRCRAVALLSWMHAVYVSLATREARDWSDWLHFGFLAEVMSPKSIRMNLCIECLYIYSNSAVPHIYGSLFMLDCRTKVFNKLDMGRATCEANGLNGFRL